MKKLYFFSAIIFFSYNIKAQVGIGTTTPEAALDISSNTGGFLPPRIALLSTTDIISVKNPKVASTSLVNGTIVYNTNTISDVTPGYYYWNGTSWKRLSANGDNWSLTGSTGTDPLTNFIGTTDAQDFVAKTNNTERLRITSAGNVNTANINIGSSSQFQVNSTGNITKINNVTTSWPSSQGSAKSILLNDGSGNLSWSPVGQIMRFGLNTGSFGTTELPIRFDNHDSTGEMGNAPSGNANFINTITGSTITSAVSLSAGTGTLARTTDRVSLPAGLYKLTMRLSVLSANTALSSWQNIYFKIIINNNEYSLQEAGFQRLTGGKTGITVTDFLDLSTDSLIDFSTKGDDNYSLLDKTTPSGGGNSYRSLIMIERIK